MRGRSSRIAPLGRSKAAGLKRKSRIDTSPVPGARGRELFSGSCAASAGRRRRGMGNSPADRSGSSEACRSVARAAHGSGPGRILWSGGVRTTRCCGLGGGTVRSVARNGSKRCAGRATVRKWLIVDGREVNALHSNGGGCAPAAGPWSVVAEPEEPRITRMTPIWEGGRTQRGEGAKIREEQIRRVRPGNDASVHRTRAADSGAAAVGV